MFIKPYKFLFEKNEQRFVYICTPHQVKKIIYRLKNKKIREDISSRHEFQKPFGIDEACFRLFHVRLS